MHAERDIVLANPSVCPSHAGIVSKRMPIVKLFPSSGRDMASFFLGLPPKFQEELP